MHSLFTCAFYPSPPAITSLSYRRFFLLHCRQSVCLSNACHRLRSRFPITKDARKRCSRSRRRITRDSREREKGETEGKREMRIITRERKRSVAIDQDRRLFRYSIFCHHQESTETQRASEKEKETDRNGTRAVLRGSPAQLSVIRGSRESRYARRYGAGERSIPSLRF